jgi:hypothetical protein
MRVKYQIKKSDLNDFKDYLAMTSFVIMETEIEEGNPYMYVIVTTDSNKDKCVAELNFLYFYLGYNPQVWA